MALVKKQIKIKKVRIKIMPAYKDEKTGSWYAKFYYEGFLGERKTKFKRGFETKKDALDYEREFLVMQQGSVSMKLESFVEVYFKDKEGRLKLRTVDTKRKLIEQKIIPYFAEKTLDEITPLDLMKWQNDLLNKGFKPTYLRMIQNQMTALFNHAERFYGLKNNPCKKIDKMGKPNAKELNFWTKEEFDIFIDSFSDDEKVYKLIYELLFWLGCRIGEVMALTFSDIDYEKSTVTINKTLFRRGKEILITTPKTESSVREVTIPEFLVDEIKQYAESIYKPEKDNRLFELTDRAVQKKIKSKANKCHLKPIRVHDLRHSHVAFLIEKGVQPLVIAQRVGHDSVNTTMNIYGHLYPNKQKQVADMLNMEALGQNTENKIISIDTMNMTKYSNKISI
jgi:phage integrase family protein